MSRLAPFILLSLLCLCAAAPAAFADAAEPVPGSNQCSLAETATLAGAPETALPPDFVANAVAKITSCTSSSQCPCPPPACFCIQSLGHCICDTRLCCFGQECP